MKSMLVWPTGFLKLPKLPARPEVEELSPDGPSASGERWRGVEVDRSEPGERPLEASAVFFPVFFFFTSSTRGSVARGN